LHPLGVDECLDPFGCVEEVDEARDCHVQERAYSDEGVVTSSVFSPELAARFAAASFYLGHPIIFLRSPSVVHPASPCRRARFPTRLRSPPCP
jgi:hypothetical protein